MYPLPLPFDWSINPWRHPPAAFVGGIQFPHGHCFHPWLNHMHITSSMSSLARHDVHPNKRTNVYVSTWTGIGKLVRRSISGSSRSRSCRRCLNRTSNWALGSLINYFKRQILSSRMRFLLHVRKSPQPPPFTRWDDEQRRPRYIHFASANGTHASGDTASFMVSSSSSGKMRRRRRRRHDEESSYKYAVLSSSCGMQLYLLRGFFLPRHATSLNIPCIDQHKARCAPREGCRSSKHGGGDECALNLWRWINVHQDFLSSPRGEWEFDLCFGVFNLQWTGDKYSEMFVKDLLVF